MMSQSQRREKIRELLTTHTRLLTGRCQCGASTETTWLWVEHLTDVVDEVIP